MADTATAPGAILRREEELPFVDLGAGNKLQLLHVDLANGLWIVRNKFDPGTIVQKHRHTGPVYAFTQSGSWHYLEYPHDVNVAGSYLFEPAGSVHTLHVLDSNEGPTDVWFTIHGANLNLAADDSVEMVVDAQLILAYYRALCVAQFDLKDPPVVVIDY